jgi:hypothetical protein
MSPCIHCSWPTTTAYLCPLTVQSVQLGLSHHHGLTFPTTNSRIHIKRDSIVGFSVSVFFFSQDYFFRLPGTISDRTLISFFLLTKLFDFRTWVNGQMLNHLKKEVWFSFWEIIGNQQSFWEHWCGISVLSDTPRLSLRQNKWGNTNLKMIFKSFLLLLKSHS